MPRSSYNKSGSVSETQLAPHLRKRFNGGGGATDAAQVASVKLTSGEAFKAGTPLYIGDLDGKVYKSALTNQVNAIALEDAAAANQLVRVALSGFERTVTIVDATFTPGGTVYLTDAAPFLSTTRPDLIEGNYYQTLGTALSSTEFAVNLGAAYMIE